MTLEDARRRIAEKAHLNAFISVTNEEGNGPVVGVKDLVDVAGTITTGGGKLLPQVPATVDAPVISEMRKYGCVVVGKTNLHEWAFGSSSANPHYGNVRNPHDPDRIPGGSSGGSGAAVAAGMCDWAIGSDTGGSIRIPASLCGVAAIKPTFGTVNLERCVPLSSSLDTLGPMAPDVYSAACALVMMTGREDLLPDKIPNRAGLRLGVPEGWVFDLDPETRAAWSQVAANIPEVPFPDRDRMQKACISIMFAEAAAYHRTWMTEHPDRYGPDVLARLRDALAVSGADYVDALHDRERLRIEVADAMQGLDALLLPGTACVAPRIDSPNMGEPLTRFTRPFNVTGQPVVSIPVPVGGLPVGVQVIGAVHADARLIAVALALESAWKEAAEGITSGSPPFTSGLDAE
ncbi:MAG: Asp-tRNA(Asn)/Glu-tRNA(Gln) amidotransferase GatCAB subunit A [Chloroflexota bacterium]